MGYPKNFVSKWKKIPVKKLSLPMSFYHTAINILMRILSGTRDWDSDKQNLLLSPPTPSYPLPFSYTTKKVSHHHNANKIFKFIAISNGIIYKIQIIKVITTEQRLKNILKSQKKKCKCPIWIVKCFSVVKILSLLLHIQNFTFTKHLI